MTRHKRRKNYVESGHAYELTFSCYQGFQFLRAERTCNWLAEAIEQARIEHNFDVWAYVFMPEHVHLIVRPRASDISTIRQAIKSPGAQRAIQFMADNAPEWMPKISRERNGKVERLSWQSGGGYDRNITEPDTLARMMEYVHLNPVRRRLVEQAEHWKWSSASWYAEISEVVIRPDSIPTDWLGGAT